MDYNKIVSVTGLGGLFELVSSKADGGIVRSLEDNSTKFVSTRIHSFSHLESIEIYTVRDNVNLVDIFKAMKASSEQLPDAKADAKLIRSYFEKVYPDMDFERVYGSDMKKMVRWFEILLKNNIDIRKSDEAEEEVTVDNTSKKTTTTAAKPAAAKPAAAKPAAVKNAPPKKINTPRKMA